MNRHPRRKLPPVPDRGWVPNMHPSLGPGIVWSDLVREMDEEWAARTDGTRGAGGAPDAGETEEAA
jgi:Family of unknown function (DUF6222)